MVVIVGSFLDMQSTIRDLFLIIRNLRLASPLSEPQIYTDLVDYDEGILNF
jgi:hypothetical protein